PARRRTARSIPTRARHRPRPRRSRTPAAFPTRSRHATVAERPRGRTRRATRRAVRDRRSPRIVAVELPRALRGALGGAHHRLDERDAEATLFELEDAVDGGA